VLVADLQDVRKVYDGGVVALKGATIMLESGRVHCVLGRNGAGKTTLLRILATQLSPTSGRVYLFGFDALKEPGRVRDKLAVIPQGARLLPVLTPWDHVFNYLLLRGFGFSEARRRAREALELLELEEYSNVSALNLSGGMRQRVLVAMCISSCADFLLMDEPTVGLDPLARRRVWSAISKVVREEGRTVLLTTHYLEEAEVLSEKVVILHGGRVLSQGSPQELRTGIPERVRVDIHGDVGCDLSVYGRVRPYGRLVRVLTDEKRAEELSALALKKGLTVEVAPVTFEDVFVELVGLDGGEHV